MATLQFTRRSTRAPLATLFAGIFVLSSPFTMGAAATPPATSQTTSYVSQMAFIGYDINYLREHGLEAPAGANLVDASALEAGQTVIPARTTRGADVIVRPNATVTGPCGSSTVLATRSGSNLTIGTRYTIAGDLASEHTWYVKVQTSTMTQTYNFSGFAPLFSSTWNSDPRVVTLIGSGRNGFATVTPGSYAITATGRICYSMSPSQQFS